MKPERREGAEALAKHELVCELHGIPIKIPPATKYKKHHKGEKDQPDLEVGKMAVLSFSTRNQRVGYYLATLVDWDDETNDYWTYRANLFFVVIDRSNDKMPDRRGRIISVNIGGWSWSGLRVESWDKNFFPKKGESQ